MEAVTEDLIRADVDAEMTVLTPEEFTEQNPEDSDEVEHLRNSLREVVHDDNVRPKMQCLMMDSSFSMVTMQGEDSGIAWETTPSRCTTPWASETGNPSMELGSPVAVRSPTPGSVPAGKIIFVMDEELMTRRKKPKERGTPQRNRVLGESSENITGRPELVEVSQPNVKEGDEEEPGDLKEDKEQRLFRLVSEGSEILNIVVPPKLSTVDEEESKELVDNLSYLEDSLVPKACEDTQEYDLLVLTNGSAAVEEVRPLPSVGPSAMDPPGAPVARPPPRGAAGNVDYFEPFTLIDAQAPGSPAVVTQEQEEQEAEGTTASQGAERPARPRENSITATTVENDRLDTVSLEGITSDLLDEVFYAGTEDYTVKTPGRVDGGAAGTPARLPSKPSGSNLFGSQEEILTPIFLPEGPPKIIDPILLEEPKAMAFLYDDLYEEALGCRMKEEDRESLTSEKSFHSRHSDREARGYLEKYVLIDETPVAEWESTDKKKHPEDGPRTLYDDLYDITDMLSKPGKSEMPNSEEEITDFFRSSANSSPCDLERFPRSLEEEEETQPATKTKGKSAKNVSIKVEKAAGIPADPLSISSFELPTEEPDWGGIDDPPTGPDEKNVGSHSEQDSQTTESEVKTPVPPPRRRARKTCLNLTPLTPVDIAQEQEETGGKEQREEEKETASPAETADEGDGEETTPPSDNVSIPEDRLVEVDTKIPESVEISDEITVIDSKPAEAEHKDTETAEEEATKQTETEEVDINSSESADTEVQPEIQEDNSTVTPDEPPIEKGYCEITVIDSKPVEAETEHKDTETAEEEATKQTETEEVDINSSESAETEVQPKIQEDNSTDTPDEPPKEKGYCVIL
ncbi:cardiomyopathy-associated protein 5 [Xyrichtys novacula]|uniref:Cardiomyopathy-associated protein 5 n=1 Tax=Xyrichtys novacula TaxID=13765 RepID=A0AAV1GE17_XYRNO|nr:cardiomyopathy-associated protein 5 [Xyrichtys novacula]